MKEMTYGQSLPLYGINHILTPSTDGEIGPIRHNGMFRLRLPTTADAQSWCRAEAERWLLQQVQEVARRSHWLAMRIPGTIKCKDLNASWTRMGKGGLSLNWRMVFLPASAVQWIITRTIIDAMPYTGPTHQLYGKAMPRDYIERWRDTQMAYAGFAGNRGQQEFQKYAESAARALRQSAHKRQPPASARGLLAVRAYPPPRPARLGLGPGLGEVKTVNKMTRPNDRQRR